MSTPARQSREALGNRLRDLRKDAGLSGVELARRAGWHWSSKVSKIEHGKQTPSDADIRVWCRLTGAEREIPGLIAELRSIETMYIDLRRRLRPGTAKRQREISKDEEETTLFRSFQTFLIPGLLQTPQYAEARLTEGLDFLEISDDVDAAIQARMERQQILYKGDRRFHIILCEVALTAGMASTEVILGQLDRLLTLSALPRMRLGVVPTRAPHGYAPMNSFWIYDRRTVVVETFSASLTLTQPREVALYEKAFDRLGRTAVYGAAARSLISSSAERLQAESFTD